MVNNKGMDFKVVTWNTNKQGPSILEFLFGSSGRPDIVTLQEVTDGQADAFRKTLADVGLPHAIYTGNRKAREKRYGNVIASRWPVRSVNSDLYQQRFLWPQLLGHAAIDVGPGEIDVITAHIPNGWGNGWAKIDTFRVLADLVREVKGPLVLTGDFNEPQYRIQNDRIVTFGQAEKLPYEYWGQWSFEGRSGTGEEWDSAVRWFFERHDEHGLRNAYWAACGSCKIAVTHRTRHGNPRWFDHVFLSDDLKVRSCRYVHTVRLKGLSDHSAFVVHLVVRDNTTLKPPSGARTSKTKRAGISRRSRLSV